LFLRLHISATATQVPLHPAQFSTCGFNFQ
jgi:hypothetical protein